MTGYTSQESSRSSVKFALKARGHGQQQQNESEGTHRRHAMRACWSGSASPRRRRSRSPLPRAPQRGEAAPSGESGHCDQPVCEIGKSKEDSEKVLGPRGHCFELECQLEVTNTSLSHVEKHLAELRAARAVIEEQAKAAQTTLETIKERRSAFHTRLQAAVTTGQKVLGDAKAAVNLAEAKIDSLVQDTECEAATLATHTKATKTTISETEAHISALEAANPGLGAVALAASINQATGDSKVNEVETPPVVTDDVKHAAEDRCIAMRAKLAELKERRGKALSVLASQGGEVGQLASRAVELEAKLEKQRDTVSQLQARAKELGVDEDSLLSVAPSAPARKPLRLLAISSASPEIAGEYKLLPDAISDRPAYEHKGSSDAPVYLFWSSAGGRCSWVFAEELPGKSPIEAGLAANTSGAATPDQPKSILARSAQDAWTVLPDELDSSRWEAGGLVMDITLVSKGS